MRIRKGGFIKHRILQFTSIFLFTFSFINSYSQVTQEWVSRYNGPGNSSDEGSSIAVDGSGNVYVTGHSIGSGTFGDYATIKYNSTGVQQWVQRYNGPGNSFERAYSIAVDGPGNVYVTGRSTGNGTAYDFATIKYNSAGVQQWVQRYNGTGSGDDEARSIAVDGSGNVYVTGYSRGIGTGDDFAAVKYNSSGVQQWVQRYNGPGDSTDHALSIAVDNSGNVYLTGYSFGNGTNYDYAAIKYNLSGIQQWVQRYNGPGNYDDKTSAIVLDISGNVYVTGYSFSGPTNYNYTTIKYNTSGVQQWVQNYIGPGSGSGLAIAVDISGYVYVTGYSSASGSYVDYATIKYNSSGVQQWAQRYNGPGNFNDYAYSIAVDSSGNVYVTGASYGSGTSSDYATIKYNSSGAQQWVERYNGPGNNLDVATANALDGSGNIYVTGWSYGNGTDYDYATIKYSQLTGIQSITSEIPEQYGLSQNYPNPFNPSTIIKFDIPSFPPFTKGGAGGFVTLKVYDILGREVAILVNEELKPGSYEVEWSAADGASNYPSGVYFYKLTAGDFVETKKMILIK